MENIFNIVWLIITAISLLNGIIAWSKAYKNGNATEAEKAKNAINAEIKKLVANAEVTYEAWDKSLKASGTGTAGNMKKSFVMMAIKTFCLENGFTWNEEAIDKAVEDEVAYTKTVNAKC